MTCHPCSSDRDRLVLNGAPSQYDRWLRILGSGAVRVDGRSFAELLDFAVEFASLINFYDLDDQVDGDWVGFFLADPTMILASIVAADPRQLEAEWRELRGRALEETASEAKLELLRQLFQQAWRLARKLNLWLMGSELADDDVLRRLRRQLSAAAGGGLGRRLRAFAGYAAGAEEALGQAIEIETGGFLPIWNLDAVRPDPSIYEGSSPRRKVDRALPALEPIFSALLALLADLRSFARSYLPATFERADHKPQIALYIAFVELFRSAQHTVDSISLRYASFYYRQVLRESRRGAVPDTVYLAFSLADDEEVLRATVPAGTLFAAGEDPEGTPTLYASDRSLTVGAARIDQVRTLRVIDGPLVVGQPDSDDLPRQVLASEVFLEAAEAGGIPWSTFGPAALPAEAGEAEITRLASLGFAVASPYLLLAGGTRRVTLSLRLSNASAKTLTKRLYALARAAGCRDCEREILDEVLTAAFTLWLTTADGWLRVESWQPCPPPAGDSWDPTRLCLEFELPPDAPAIAAYDPEEPVEDQDFAHPTPDQPTLQARLQQEPVPLTVALPDRVECYPLSLFSDLALEEIELSVGVRGLPDLELENTDGEIDPSSPFLVFGGLPVKGSYLRMRHPELFVKTLESLQVELAWFNLPQNPTGFSGYYRDYRFGLDGRRQPGLFDNRTFHGGLSVKDPGTWFLARVQAGEECPQSPPGSLDVYLFRTTDDCAAPVPRECAPLCPDTVFEDFEVCPAERPPDYYDPDRSALQLELTAPPYAFGNDLYNQNVLSSVIEDLPDTEKCRDGCLDACEVLLEAVGCLDLCLQCLDRGGSDCVEQCIDCLLQKLLCCLAGCRSLCPRLEEQLTVIESQLLECFQEPPGRVRCVCLEEVAGELRALLPPTVNDGPTAEGPCAVCITECLAILEGLLCVMKCTGQCHDDLTVPDDPKACLRECRDGLYGQYEDCLRECMEDCMKIRPDPPGSAILQYPNEPYLPQAESVTLTYTATCKATFPQEEAACARFVHLLPFAGYRAITPPVEAPVTFLPQFQFQRNLYLGFSRLIPPQTLTLLFQMVAAGQGCQNGSTSSSVEWACLSKDRWRCLPVSRTVADSTRGLEGSGIVALELPAYDPAGNTVLAGDLQWLRATASNDAGAFPDTVGIYPYAVPATWVDDENTGAHLEQPLPAGTITGAVEDLPDIAGIQQPMESFGGRPPEGRRAFDVRMGERLRHKDRAILGWDYERLVLEAFPTIWKVRALPARSPAAGNQPGNVLVVVVPGPDSPGVVDPTAPAASAETLCRIRDELALRTSTFLVCPFLNLWVVNPTYVRVEVRTRVVFRGDDPGGAIERLDRELVEYLSPWFYDAERAERGGDYATEAAVSEFIQTRDYVDSLIALELCCDPDPATLEWYFLTSAKRHVINEEETICEDPAGY